MKNPIKLLQDEHKLILQAVEIGKSIQNVKEDKVYYKLIHDFILFIRNYTEVYHYPKEENIFYPLLRNRSEGLNGEFIFEISDNHEDFKALVAEIENHYVNYDYRQLRLTMKKYLKELADHINRENKTILNIASTLFTEKELEILYNKFIELDEKHGDKDELRKQVYKIGEQVF